MQKLGWSEAEADQFRARIWKPDEYPIWQEFIQQIKQAINKMHS
jgi:hypothetical protein